MKSKIWFLRILALTTLLAAGAIMGCGGDDDDDDQAAQSPTTAPNETSSATQAPAFDAVVAAAQKEGKVVWFGGYTDPLIKSVVAEFHKKYPEIAVEFHRTTQAELGTRLSAELQSGNVSIDLATHADSRVFEPTTASTVYLSLQDLPSAEGWPTAYNTGFGVLTTIAVWGIAINTQLVSAQDEPKDWPDLLDPKWKGKLLLPDPRNSLPWVDWALMMRELYGDEYLRSFAQQGAKLVESVVPGSQELAAGEASALLPTVQIPLNQLQASGAPVKLIVPSKTSGAELWSGVLAKGPHSNAGLVLLNWLMSPEGQIALNAPQPAVSVLPNLEGVPPFPSNYRPANPAGAGAAMAELIQLLGIK